VRATVLVTRTPAECAGLAAALEPHGIEVKPYPVLRVEEVEDGPGWRRLAEALEGAGPRPTWLALASPRAPGRFVAAAGRHGLRTLLELPAAAVGAATARAAREAGLEVTLVGDAGAAALASALLERLEAGAAVVLPRGRHARRELPEALERAGHPVLPVTVYAMRPAPPRELPPLGPRVDAVVLTSPRTARYYLEAVGGRPLPVPHWAIGATTRDAAAALGIACRTPAHPDMETLAEELCRSL